MKMKIPFFVVACTGRCGSTLLSEMFELHPKVLSISEFLVPLILSGVHHSRQVMTAQEFCSALRAHMPTTSALLRAGISVPEFRYPFKRIGARYSKYSGLPFLVNGALSHLTKDPDSAFDTLLESILIANGACAGDHLSSMFRKLRELFGGSVIIERSGGSLLFTKQIRALLPEASFILLTRRGVDTALSMSCHAYFRHIALRSVLSVKLGYDPYVNSRRDGTEALSEILLAQLPEHFTKAGFETVELPLDIFGAIWSHHTENGLFALPKRFYHLTYENLCADPGSLMSSLANHIGVTPNHQWLDAIINKIKPPSRRLEALCLYELESLRAACKPGETAMAVKGVC